MRSFFVVSLISSACRSRLFVLAAACLLFFARCFVFSSLMLGGSRSLPSSAFVAPFVAACVPSVQSFSVGCCVGADAHLLSLLPSSRVSVFAAFSPSGSGACSLSAVSAVRSAVARGASVSWLAGGSLAVPLAARLVQRSFACVRSVAPAGACVFFAPGSGSLVVAAFAASLSLPVFAFAPTAPAPLAGGAWVSSSLFSLPCFAWQPAQGSLF